MRRRDFITVIGGAAAAWPLAARAQQARPTRRIGTLMPLAEDDGEEQKRVKAFVQALRELGWIDGDNVRIDYRWGGSDANRIRADASELIALKPDAILASTALAVVPLRQATSTIPIVFLQIADPSASAWLRAWPGPAAISRAFPWSSFP